MEKCFFLLLFVECIIDITQVTYGMFDGGRDTHEKEKSSRWSRAQRRK